jgi:hypothetical protein
MASKNSTFVSIPTDRLMAAIRAMDLPISEKLAGREKVVDVHARESMKVVRVYTSISDHASEVRGSGEDAVRLVVGTFSRYTDKFFPTRAGVTLKRTAPRDPSEDRRIMAWIARFSSNLASMIEIAERTQALPCPRCYNPMVYRVRARDKRPFLGCANYPTCTFACDMPQDY